MALREEARPAPTLERARAAAAVLRDEGAAAVLLYGSVADGAARESSDVDLVAVFDDIDYAQRHRHRRRLEARCAAAAGVPVDVHVTDRPEWDHRARKVSSSFEASIAMDTQTLYERAPEPGAVRWGKEIGMPDSNLQEALERLTGVHQALGRMTAACRPRDDETRTVDGRVEVHARNRDGRLRDLCADAAMTIENSLKAWAALNGARSERTHSIDRLLERASPLTADFNDALAPLRTSTMRPSRGHYDDVTVWRIGAAYPSALPQATPGGTERLARLLADAAVAAAEQTLNRLVDEGADAADERIADCRRRLSDTRALLDAGDVVAGIRR